MLEGGGGATTELCEWRTQPTVCTASKRGLRGCLTERAQDPLLADTTTGPAFYLGGGIATRRHVCSQQECIAYRNRNLQAFGKQPLDPLLANTNQADMASCQQCRVVDYVTSCSRLYRFLSRVWLLTGWSQSF
jgi:hypothetical protein